MSNLQVINEQEVLGKNFTIYGTLEEPLFLARDVAEWIEHNNTTLMLNSVDESEKLMYVIHKSGQNREMWFLTEDGLYEVLMQSRKPIAKEFKKQVKAILKSIRTNGGYILGQEELKPEEIVARALIVANNIIDKQQKELEEKTKTLGILMHVKKLYTTTEIAKELGLKSAIALNNKLSDMRIQYKQNGTYVLYSKYSDLGYESIKQEVLDNGRVIYHRKWTQRGRKFILSKLKEC